MKLKKKKTFKCTKIFPILIWKECCVCLRKFGLEHGYTNSNPLSIPGRAFSVCKVCCEGSAQKADIVFDKKRQDFLNSRPQFPVPTAAHYPPPPPVLGSNIHPPMPIPKVKPRGNNNNNDCITQIK